MNIKHEIKVGQIYYCNRSRIYEFLCLAGFTPAFVKPDFRDTNRLVWCFERTPELLDCLNWYAIKHNSEVIFVAK